MTSSKTTPAKLRELGVSDMYLSVAKRNPGHWWPTKHEPNAPQFRATYVRGKLTWELGDVC